MPASGQVFRDRVKLLVEKVIAEMGLEKRFRVETEYLSPHGSVVRDRDRRVDVAVLDSEGRPYLFIECKWQTSSGTAEDKLFRSAEEARRDRIFGVHSVVVLGGSGFNRKVFRWALTEGFVHETFLETWLREFFGR
ncbi:MAG: PD-(D/E)XK nuclease superfamily protein [Thermus sp.]|uniref:PD-(D/E)XK nuclease superfamily protein n=1 Tax=Thermus sp. TaxID=275 RepID=UPI00391DDE72